MNCRTYSRTEQDKLLIAPGYLRALKAFRDYTAEHGVTPAQASLGEYMGKSKSTAAQALRYLTFRGFLELSTSRYRPWILSKLGVAALRRAERVKAGGQKGKAA